MQALCIASVFPLHEASENFIGQVFLELLLNKLYSFVQYRVILYFHILI